MTAFLFVTDLDNTLVGDDAAMSILNERLSRHRQQYGTTIVYSTGRSLTSYRHLTQEKSLLQPDVLITAVGTDIYHAESTTPDAQWSAHLSQGWDRDTVVAAAAHFADLSAQPESEQRPFKVSYFLTEAAAVEVLPRLEQVLQERGLDVQLIYSGSQDLDILPRPADKGQAMSYIREALGVAPSQTVACGDSGNDIALFRDRSERGIIVANARPELLDWHQTNPNPNRYLAQAPCATGILEGLRHFQFL